MIRTLRGTVVSDKMDKTVVVAVSSLKEHPIYRKKYKVTSKFKAHDAENSCQVGDLVEITETRPVSRDKRWLVARKVTAKEMEA
jgi:small subunit ribosomal protein S17